MNYHDEVEKINSSLSRRFGFEIDIELIGIIKYYEKVETRGFLIFDYIKGEYYECIKEVILSGDKLIKQSFPEP